LDWFKEYFVNSTRIVDYKIEGINEKSVIIRREGTMIMPLDVTVTDTKGKLHKFNIPLDIMRGAKKGDQFFDQFEVADDWTWTHPTYSLNIGLKQSEVSNIEIDASKRLVDVNRDNNFFPSMKMLPREDSDK
jgi:hypothetical protein